MRYRVERVRTDHGYGTGWVVLDENGDVVQFAYGWRFAMVMAFTLALSEATG